MHHTHPEINPTKIERLTAQDLRAMTTGNKQEIQAKSQTWANQQTDAVLAMEEEIQTRRSTEANKITNLVPIAKFVTIKDI